MIKNLHKQARINDEINFLMVKQCNINSITIIISMITASIIIIVMMVGKIENREIETFTLNTYRFYCSE